jgi:hypothetical protein
VPDVGSPGAAGWSAGAVPIIADRPAEPVPSTGWGEAIAAVGIAALITVLGFPLGWLWSAVAPWTPVQMTSQGAVLSQPEQEQLVADEGWYLLITVVAGLLIAGLAWVVLRRYRGAPMLAGVALGGVFGGVVTWWFGHNVGADHFRDLLEHAPIGTNFGAPVNLRVQQVGLWHHWLPYARGDVLALAIAATVLYLLLTGFSSYSSLRGPDPSAPSPFYPQPAGYPAGGYPLGGYPAGGYPTGGSSTGGYPAGGYPAGGTATGGSQAGGSPQAGGFPAGDPPGPPSGPDRPPSGGGELSSGS